MINFRITSDGINYRIEKEVSKRCGFLWMNTRMVWRPVNTRGNVSKKEDYDLTDWYDSKYNCYYQSYNWQGNAIDALLQIKNNPNLIDELVPKKHAWRSVVLPAIAEQALNKFNA